MRLIFEYMFRSVLGTQEKNVSGFEGGKDQKKGAAVCLSA